ncbi:hypothetical protein [Streptomyces olivochromogenes]|uniref:hypothetical protein n=1 Tax=Streptomyces olivochromogenes TaxID=1963 RepID=UPI003693A96B
MMAAKLKSEGLEEQTVQIFNVVDQDAQSLKDMRSDPDGFFRGLLEAEGIPVRDLVIDIRVTKLTDGGEAPGTTVAHITSPASRRSQTIVVIMV